MKFFFAIILIFLSSSAVFASDESAVVEESDFQKLASQMKLNKMGLVMMLHAEYCEFCALMDEKILSPMERSGDYKNRVYIRKIQIDKPEMVKDFNGRLVSASDIVAIYDSGFDPNVDIFGLFR